jgi:hypothetical protein
MKRDIKINVFGGESDQATIVIDKDGMHVDNKKPIYEQDDYFIRHFLSNCINMDSWKHSWHLDVSKAWKKGSDERKKIYKIIEDKIKDREEQIQMLKDARQILGRWHY